VPESEIFSVEQLSQFLGVPVSTIHGLTRGRARKHDAAPLPFLKIGKRCYFRKVSVLAWLESRERAR
jgi:predicted DNA-binding transcriptional regulator AlpA